MKDAGAIKSIRLRWGSGGNQKKRQHRFSLDKNFLFELLFRKTSKILVQLVTKFGLRNWQVFGQSFFTSVQLILKIKTLL